MKPLSIIGRGCRYLNGVKDETRERWIVSSAYFDNPEEGKVCEKIFQLHNPTIWESGCKNIKEKLIVAWDKEGFGFCQVLPYKELVKEFGEVFPSSISWMLAYALFLGYDDIELHGVDMMGVSEYAGQRDHLFYLIGVARGRGVKITMQAYAGVYLSKEVYGVPI